MRSRSANSPQLFLESLFLPKTGAPIGKPSRTGSKLGGILPKHPRSISYPNDLAQAHGQSLDLGFDASSDAQTLALPRLQHSFTEPAPTRHKTGSKELPRALILSGIEKSSAPVQHALSNVLSERSIALDEDIGGIWKFPSGFITIYVCSLNNSRRPAIEKSLVSGASIKLKFYILTIRGSWTSSH